MTLPHRTADRTNYSFVVTAVAVAIAIALLTIVAVVIPFGFCFLILLAVAVGVVTWKRPPRRAAEIWMLVLCSTVLIAGIVAGAINTFVLTPTSVVEVEHGVHRPLPTGR